VIDDAGAATFRPSRITEQKIAIRQMTAEAINAWLIASLKALEIESGKWTTVPRKTALTRFGGIEAAATLKDTAKLHTIQTIVVCPEASNKPVFYEEHEAQSLLLPYREKGIKKNIESGRLPCVCNGRSIHA
jgi:hypothetical protein